MQWAFSDPISSASSLSSDDLMLVASLLAYSRNPVLSQFPSHTPVTLHFYFAATRAVMLVTIQGAGFYFICHFKIGFRFKTNRLAEKSNLFLADPHTGDYSCISDVFPLLLWKFVGQSIKIPCFLRCFQFYLVGKEWWLRLARFMKCVEKYNATETACLFKNRLLFKKIGNRRLTICQE